MPTWHTVPGKVILHLFPASFYSGRPSPAAAFQRLTPPRHYLPLRFTISQPTPHQELSKHHQWLGDPEPYQLPNWILQLSYIALRPKASPHFQNWRTVSSSWHRSLKAQDYIWQTEKLGYRLWFQIPDRQKRSITQPCYELSPPRTL